jgi:NAD(P)-dependent dehydrogenase (short-subunit alcohol dehydrogenase family)
MTTILVTGANRGIGLEFARQYAADKAEVIACCRNPAGAGTLKALGVTVMELDVAKADSATRLADALNGKPIDILINNAGVYGPKMQSAVECDYEGIVETFRINSLGPLMVSQALRANLLKGRDKKLAVLTSKMGSISDSSGGVIAYRASKAALNMIFHAVAKSWARDGVAVAILHPGWVKTDMGGPDAMIGAEESVRGLRARIAELDRRNSGRFLDYQGKEIGW